MAARRKSAKRKSSSKSKAARRKKPAAKKPARKKASKKKAPARKKPAAKKAPARKAVAKTPPIESLARKLIQATKDPAKMNLEELYAEGVVSREPGCEPVVGLAGMREKFSNWASAIQSATWKVRNSFVKQNTICIEWEAEIELKSGRRFPFEEVSVHQVKGGKIVEERYYCDPAIFESPAEPSEPETLEESLLPSTPVAPPIADLLDPDEPRRHDDLRPPFEEEEEAEESDIDPLDL
jgi:ketosteroid isomerase-like protein